MTTQVVSAAGSNISFSNTYGTGVTAAYEDCIVSAEQDIEALWTAPSSITINLDFIGSNEGQNGDLASNSFYTVDVTYSQLKSALASHDSYSVYAEDAVAALPSTDPSDGKGFELPEAYAQMLGLTGSNTADTVTLNTGYDWSYGQDVINTLEHEISEGGMGRVGGLGGPQNDIWSTMDLFRYNASGAPDYTDGEDGQLTYFSYNGGSTLSLSAGLSFNNELNTNGTTNNEGDTADFTQQDVFGTGSPGETNTYSQTDIEMMDVLGWEPITTTLYDFWFEYPDGSIYYGTVADNGTYGYYVGETVDGTTKGYYYIYASSGTTTETSGTVSDTSYYDSFTGETSTPYYYTHLNYSGTTGLNADFDYVYSNGQYQTFGYGGEYEADNETLIEPKSTLPVASGGAATILPGFLLSFDIDDSTGAFGNPEDITYTVTAPAHGVIFVNGAPASSFTQADIDDGLVQYLNDGDGATSDGFTFTVSDPAGHQITEGFNIAIVNTTAPVVDANAALPVSVGGTAMLMGRLDTVALGNQPGDLSYTVITAPAHGSLLDNGVAATSFTQTDIDDGLVQYVENGDNATSDSFTFTVSDAAGDHTALQTFNIAIAGATEPVASQGDNVTAVQSNTATISDGSQLELQPGTSENVQFAGTTGTLKLDASSGFTGSVSGFGAQDQIDLTDIAFGANTTLGYSANSSNGGGTLTVGDGVHTANLALLGNYMASSFVTSSDGHGGTLVTDPTLTAEQPLVTQPHA